MLVKPIVDVVFEFGPFRLIPSQQALLRDGRNVKLGGRALGILQLLVMRAGEEVSKRDLIEWAWPNIFIDEQNLKVHINALRRALRDTLPQATYIVTVVGHGYKFVGPVQTRSIEVESFLRTEPPFSFNLPKQPCLIGRQHDVEDVCRAVDVSSLVTLVGAGGVGKTSLAIAVSHARRDEFPDGVRYVDLSSTDDPALVPHLIATCLGVRSDPANLITAVLRHLAHRRILVVLDNCDHVLAGTATIVGRLVESKIRSSILATSREPLRVRNETIWRVEPLSFPQQTQGWSVSEALAFPAIELFALRGFERAEYTLTEGDVPVVGQICRKLDGLPLAIEIVAANLNQFPLIELLQTITRRFSDLKDDYGATHSRHKTLLATLDWSYQLLSAEDATIFRLLSVFVGSFDWTDVSTMARVAQYDPRQITTALGSLVTKSLISAEIDGGQITYRILETVKYYGAERLLQDPLAHAACYQHAQLMLSIFKKSAAEWAWVDTPVWRDRYNPRTGDLRRALDWCFEEGGDASVGVDLSIAAMRFWNEQSSMFEQLFQADRALKNCASVADAPRRKAVLATSRAWCMAFGGQLHAATDGAWNSALRFAELSEDVDQRLSVMCGKALFLLTTGRLEQSVSLLDDVIRIATDGGHRASLSDGERLRAMAEARRGKLVDAQTELERLAADLVRGMPQSSHVRYQLQSYVSIHGMLAFSNWLTGRPKRALKMVDEVVVRTGENGHLMGQSRTLALFAVPLALWSGHKHTFDRYSRILERNLERGHIVMWEHVHRFYASVGRYAQGEADAIDDMRSAIDNLVHDRFLERAPMYLGILAEATLAEGGTADASHAVERALALQRRTTEIWCLPELLRVKARIMNAQGDRYGAEMMLRKARKKAQEFGAKSFELRINNDMAQMAIDNGDYRKAADLIWPIYASFEDEEVTEDLKRTGRMLAAIRAKSALSEAADRSVV